MHAYLIMAHDDLYVLEKQISLIDDERNDIYIHFDKKNKLVKLEYIEKLVKKSKIFILKNRISCYWADSSLVEAEIELLKEAQKNEKYEYYHLMSEACLPIKSQDYIHKFFKENQGKEFVQYDPIKYEFGNYKFKYYHFFLKNKYYRKNLFLKGLRYFLVEVQKKIRYERKIKYELKHGSQWFSITNNGVNKILQKENEIRKLIKNTLACDEIIIQTLLYNSELRENIYNFEKPQRGNMRLIDFKRGKPYIFQKKDLNEILMSDLLFCRKFSSKLDKKVIDSIYFKLKKSI